MMYFAKGLTKYGLVLVLSAVVLFQYGCSSKLSTSSLHSTSLESIVPDSVAMQIAQEHYLSGTLAEEMDDYLEAAYEYQIALLYNPKSPTIAAALAVLYAKLDLDGVDAAIIFLEKSLVINPNDEKLLKLYAHLCFSADYYMRAYNAYQTLSTVRPLLKYEHMRLARLLLQFNRVDDALGMYDSYLERFGIDTEVLNRIGHIHLVRGSVERADSVLRYSIEINPTQAATFFILGGIAVSKEDWQEAESLFINAVANDSSKVRYWTNLMLALSEQQKYEKMVAVSESASAVFPSIPQFHDMRGSALEQLGRLDEALSAVEKSIAIDSSRVGVFLTKGFIHHRREEWQLGAEAYEMALSIDPENPLVLNNYAYMLSIQNHRLEDALAMANRAIRSQPDTPSFLDTRGWIHFLLGNNKRAMLDIKKAVKLDILNAEIYYHLGSVYNVLGDYVNAEEAWSKAIELDPDNKEYRDLLHKKD